MKLLIVTQAVDREDPILGFFHRWLIEFAQHVESIEIICLREGTHELPGNVRVHSLGKTTGRYHSIESRLRYSARFLSLMWKLRNEYDAVFVHMNPEYVLLGGLFWRAWGKRISLWYTHKSVTPTLHIATLFAHVLFSASKESFRIPTPKLRVMGHGIDVDFFSPDRAVHRENTILSVGRLSRTKRHDLVIQAAEHFSNEVWIIGDGPERKRLEELADDLDVRSRIRFFGGQSQEQLRDYYRKAGVFIHLSETGSLDKVVLEALSCGLPVVTTSMALTGLPVRVIQPTPEDIADGVLVVGRTDTDVLSSYVREHHSLQKLIPNIVSALTVTV